MKYSAGRRLHAAPAAILDLMFLRRFPQKQMLDREQRSPFKMRVGNFGPPGRVYPDLRCHILLEVFALVILLLPCLVSAAQETLPKSSEAIEKVSGPVPDLPRPLNNITRPEPRDPSAKEEILKDLQQERITYKPGVLSDPFVPFIKPQKISPPELPSEEEDLELPPDPPAPLTPLQKMTLQEIEVGLKAILWGDLGRRAVIEDVSGKGYIVQVGTPAGDRNGVIAQISNDHIVIHQESWDRKIKRVLCQNVSVKLKKEEQK